MCLCKGWESLLKVSTKSVGKLFERFTSDKRQYNEPPCSCSQRDVYYDDAHIIKDRNDINNQLLSTPAAAAAASPAVTVKWHPHLKLSFNSSPTLIQAHPSAGGPSQRPSVPRHPCPTYRPMADHNFAWGETDTVTFCKSIREASEEVINWRKNCF